MKQEKVEAATGVFIFVSYIPYVKARDGQQGVYKGKVWNVSAYGRSWLLSRSDEEIKVYDPVPAVISPKHKVEV